MTNDEKWFNKKMDRREFLKKAGIGGAGLALGVSGASAFFANQAKEDKIRQAKSKPKKRGFKGLSGRAFRFGA